MYRSRGRLPLACLLAYHVEGQSTTSTVRRSSCVGVSMRIVAFSTGCISCCAQQLSSSKVKGGAYSLMRSLPPGPISSSRPTFAIFSACDVPYCKTRRHTRRFVSVFELPILFCGFNGVQLLVCSIHTYKRRNTISGRPLFQASMFHVWAGIPTTVRPLSLDHNESLTRDSTTNTDLPRR